MKKGIKRESNEKKNRAVTEGDSEAETEKEEKTVKRLSQRNDIFLRLHVMRFVHRYTGFYPYMDAFSYPEKDTMYSKL